MESELISQFDAVRNLNGKPFRAVCYAPFTHLVFDSIGQVRTCCANHEYILGNVRTERLDEIWNGPRIEKFREAMRSYDLSHGCKFCYDKIAMGLEPDTTLRDSQLIALKFEPFEVDSGPPFWPKHFEFHLSNRCNLECVMCFGMFSHLIRAKREKLPPIPPAYDDQFFADLEKYLPHIVEANFLGGEPFLIPEMYRVWDRLIGLGTLPSCHVTTNGTIMGPQVERILNTLPMNVSVSFDGYTAETFEKIRQNASHARVMKNLLRFRDICRDRGTICGINFTISRLNWHELPDVLEFAASEGIVASASEIQWPDEFNVFSLPAAEIERIADFWQRKLDALGDRLGENRRVLEFRIRLARHRIEHPLSVEPTARSPQAEPKPTLVGNFLPQHASGRLSCDLAHARQTLCAWGPLDSVEEIVVDQQDVIVQQDLVEDGVWRSPKNYLGQPFHQFVRDLMESHVPPVEQLNIERRHDYVDHTVRLHLATGQVRQGRSIMLPILDENRRLQGARGLFCFERLSRIEGVEAGPPRDAGPLLTII